MSRTRTTLAAAAVGSLLLSLGVSASAAPKCSKTSAGVVHAADQAAGRVPLAGSTAARVVHDVVEPVACSLPV